MNKTIKEMWLKSLRSGEYKQGFRTLHQSYCDDHEYCPLGVLMDLYMKDTERSAWIKLYTSGKYVCYCPSYGKIHNTSELSVEVCKWSGLDLCNPILIVNGNYCTCTFINDNIRYTFEQIATLIEESL
jgi:hypothetical protein